MSRPGTYGVEAKGVTISPSPAQDTLLFFHRADEINKELGENYRRSQNVSFRSVRVPKT